MSFYVFGSDEKMYGPVDVPTMQSWAREGRLSSETKLRNAESGEETTWALIDPAGPPPPVVASDGYSAVSPYPRTGYATAPMTAPSGNAGNGYFTWALIDSIGAIVLFFFLHGFGLIFAAYGVYNGYKAFASGHKLGWLALGMGIVSVIAVGLGWLLRIGMRA